MYHARRKGFTLTELIVVIVILAILATVAFLAFQSYTRDARNSQRMSDVANIVKGLDIRNVQSGAYPDPDAASGITFSGQVVWTQGVFWNAATRQVKELDDKPVDPLFGVEYTYSVTHTKQEMEVWAALEDDGNLFFAHSSSIPGVTTAYAEADTPSLTSYVRGSYNGMAIRRDVNAVVYILAVPTIIAGDITDVNASSPNNIQQLFDRLAYPGAKNIPGGYAKSNIITHKLGNWDYDRVKTDELIVFSWASMPSSAADFTLLAQEVGRAYSGTAVAIKEPFNKIIAAADDTSKKGYGEAIACVILGPKGIGGKTCDTGILASNNGNGNGGWSGEKITDPKLLPYFSRTEFSGRYAFVVLGNRLVSVSNSGPSVFDFLVPKASAERLTCDNDVNIYDLDAGKWILSTGSKWTICIPPYAHFAYDGANVYAVSETDIYKWTSSGGWTKNAYTYPGSDYSGECGQIYLQDDYLKLYYIGGRLYFDSYKCLLSLPADLSSSAATVEWNGGWMIRQLSFISGSIYFYSWSGGYMKYTPGVWVSKIEALAGSTPQKSLIFGGLIYHFIQPSIRTNYVVANKTTGKQCNSEIPYVCEDEYNWVWCRPAWAIEAGCEEAYDYYFGCSFAWWQSKDASWPDYLKCQSLASQWEERSIDIRTGGVTVYNISSGQKQEYVDSPDYDFLDNCNGGVFASAGTKILRLNVCRDYPLPTVLEYYDFAAPEKGIQEFTANPESTQRYYGAYGDNVYDIWIKQWYRVADSQWDPNSWIYSGVLGIYRLEGNKWTAWGSSLRKDVYFWNVCEKNCLP